MCDVSIVDGIAEINDGRDDNDATSDMRNSLRDREGKNTWLLASLWAIWAKPSL